MFGLGKVTKIGKSATDIGSIALRDVAKDTATMTAKTTARSTASTVADALMKNKGKLFLGAAAIGAGTYLAVDSKKESDRINNATYKIIKIEKGKNDAVPSAIITYSPSEKILKTDIINLFNVNTNPLINGTYTVKNVLNATQVEINIYTPLINGSPLNNATGTMKIKTDPSQRASDTVVSGATDVGNTIGGGLGGAAGGAGGSFVDKFKEGLGISSDTSTILVVIIIIIFCACVICKIMP